MKLLNKFAKENELKVVIAESSRGGEIQGTTGKISGPSCPCGGCLSLWCSSASWQAHQNEAEAQGVRPLGVVNGYRECLFDPCDPGQVEMALTLVGLPNK